MADPPILTPEQLDYFTEQTRRVVQRERAYDRRRFTRWIRGALVGYFVLFLGILAMYQNGQSTSDSERAAIVQSGRVIAVDGCNRDFKTNERVRNLILAAQELTNQQIAKGKVTPEEAQQARDYYNSQLAGLVLPNCTEAETLLTDDPNAVIDVPTPLKPPAARPQVRPDLGIAG